MEQNLKEKTIFLQYTQKRYRTKLSAAGAKRDTKIHKKKVTLLMIHSTSVNERSARI